MAINQLGNVYIQWRSYGRGDDGDITTRVFFFYILILYTYCSLFMCIGIYDMDSEDNNSKVLYTPFLIFIFKH